MDPFEKSKFLVNGVSVELSPQITEMTDWLRGQDLYERSLPASEIDIGLSARRKAFTDLVALFAFEIYSQHERRGTCEGYVDIDLAINNMCSMDGNSPQQAHKHQGAPITDRSGNVNYEYDVTCPRCGKAFGV